MMRTITTKIPDKDKKSDWVKMRGDEGKEIETNLHIVGMWAETGGMPPNVYEALARAAKVWNTAWRKL